MKPSKIKLKYKDRDFLFKKEYSQFKIKVALNWFEIIALICVTFFISFKILLSFKVSSLTTNLVIALAFSLIIALIFSYFRNYQLKITRFDKEDIYKKISNDLIEESKNKQ